MPNVAVSPPSAMTRRVVVEPMGVAVAAQDHDLLRVEVDLLDLRGDGPARRSLQLRAQRGDAVARLEHPGADLGQERREEAEVLAADEPDLDVVAAAGQLLEVACGLDAGEAAAEDEDAVRPRRLGAVDRAHRDDRWHARGTLRSGGAAPPGSASR